MTIATLTCRIALSLAVVAALSAPVQAQQPTPLKIAELRPIELSLGANEAKSGRDVEIRTPDAAFVKVHFDRFSLPSGVVLEVSNPERTEVYRYSSSHRDGYTVSEELGQDGKVSFSALSIGGPVAVLRLVGQARTPWLANQGVKVTRYLEGYPEAMLPELQSAHLLDNGAKSICGVDDKRAVACYAGTTEANRASAVGRMLSGSGSLCTVWRVSSANRVFTNNHCINTQAAVAGSEFWFNYQRSTCTGAQGAVTKVTGNTMLATNASLDYTLFTVNNFASLASFGFLGLDVRNATINEGLYIAGHPGGRMKELSIADDQNGGGNCRVNGTSSNANKDIGYYCDTEGGSSGSPVLARSTNKVIALHHFGGCLNSGVKMTLIWPQVSSHFGNVIP